MKIYIDADACPVIDIAIEISSGYGIKCVLICDTSHEITRANAETVIVSKGSDSADFALVNLISSKDIAITQDYGLASMCLARRAYAINQNGLEYTSENIVYLMETRHMAKKIRMSGKRLKGPKPRSRENDELFRKAFTSLIERALSDGAQ